MKLDLRKGSRSRVLAAILILAVSVFIMRLFYLQVIRHDYYVAKANEEQLKQWVIPAKRGLIYVMNGSTPKLAVMNEAVYTVWADPTEVKDKDKSSIVSSLREIAGGNTRDGFEDLLAKKDTRYQVIATKLSRTQADKLKDKKFSGIGFQQQTQRVYPEGALAGQVLGFVNDAGIGNYGVEGALNDRLKGVDGKLQAVTDVRDVPLTLGDKNVNIPAKDGESIVLSIDRNVQNYAEDALRRGVEKAGAKYGSVLVMDPQTGKVLAMASTPSYAPADFSKVTDGAVFNNPIISDPYEPASVIKTYAMSAGLDQGVITPDSTYNNTDSITIDGKTVHNALLGLTGTRTMQDVLNNSLNTGTVTVAQRLGDGQNITYKARKTLYNYYHDRFKLGEKTGIELANESAGIVVSPDDVQGNAVRYSNMTFGQGLDVTMLQVATGFSAMINGGTYRKPSIIQGTLNADGELQQNPPAQGTAVISKKTSDDMRSMTYKARQSVSYMRSADKKGYTIGGKTGTAETLRDGSYIKTETVGTYLGYGGASTPRYVIMVRVSAPNKNLEGGLHASPIFTDISNWMIDYMKIAPEAQ